jgi:hypothetical protein
LVTWRSASRRRGVEANEEAEKSDPSIVAKRAANKPETAEVDLWGGWVESAEPREGTEGNTDEQHTPDTEPVKRAQA